MVGHECRTREDHSSLGTWGKTVALETDNESGSEEGNNLAPKCNKANTIAVETVLHSLDVSKKPLDTINWTNMPAHCCAVLM